MQEAKAARASERIATDKIDKALQRLPLFKSSQPHALDGRVFPMQHALMLVHSFYENVERDGRNVVLHFVPRPAEPMYVACLYSRWLTPEGRTVEELQAILTDRQAPYYEHEVLAA